MNWTEFFAAQLEREAPITRSVLERVPEGRSDWKPHEKSMPLGHLSQLVATMPGWVAMIVLQDELDLDPDGKGYQAPTADSRAKQLEAHDKAVADGLAALRKTTDKHLATPWRLLVHKQVVMEKPRWEVIAETMTHLAHHRGQLTVYLRLNGASVPAVYGPSADEGMF